MWILFSPEYIEYTLLGLILLPGIIFASVMSLKVNLTFAKYYQVKSAKGYTGAEVANKILEKNNILDAVVRQGDSDDLIDNYDPQSGVVTLSKRVYGEDSVASLAVAAHEIGHVIQHSEGYAPLKVRTVLAKTSSIMNAFVWPLILIGIILDFAYIGGVIGKAFLWAGVAFFGVTLLFSLVTLPVELNASKRGLKMLVETGSLDELEVKGAKKVLSAAAMTYVAAIVVSILQLLRFVLFFILNSRDRK